MQQHEQAFSYALVGRAAGARVLKGFTREGLPPASLHTGGADGPQPIPLESKEKRGLPGGDVDAPSGLGGNRTRTPRFRCRAKRQGGKPTFKTSE